MVVKINQKLEDREYTEEYFEELVKEFSKCKCETKEFPNNVKAHRYVSEQLSYYKFNDGKILKEQIMNNDGSLCLKRETTLKPVSCKK